MTDEQRILEITHKWLSADHGSQPQFKWGPDMQFLIEYIEEMELPVSTGKREIERLKKEVETFRERTERANARADEIIFANMALRDKYELDMDFSLEDQGTYFEEVDYNKVVDALIRRLK
ncbi:MAG: hypothetical protein DRN30_05895 [Thermoplasmata archaeon]|nr:MAG: hypothetical protein DRN30_05895 [Thermoplasmata archaeon]